jgi:hypothetical protein
VARPPHLCPGPLPHSQVRNGLSLSRLVTRSLRCEGKQMILTKWNTPLHAPTASTACTSFGRVPLGVHESPPVRLASELRHVPVVIPHIALRRGDLGQRHHVRPAVLVAEGGIVLARPEEVAAPLLQARIPPLIFKDIDYNSTFKYILFVWLSLIVKYRMTSYEVLVYITIVRRLITC